MLWDTNWYVCLRGPIAGARLPVLNFVEHLRGRCVRPYRLKTSYALIKMLIDCFQNYESSVDVDFFRASFPNSRRQMNSRYVRGATLLYVADHAIPKLHARSQ